MPLLEIKKSDNKTEPVNQPIIKEDEEQVQPTPAFVEAAATPQLNQQLIEQEFSKPFTEDEIVKDIPQLSITDFKRNPEVVERAIRAMGYVDKTTYEDGTKAADRFVDYARDADFNITHGAIRLAKILGQKDKQTKEDIQFRDDVSWLYNEFYSIRDDGKYKYDPKGFAENLGLAGDIFAGAVTDLTNWGAALAFPFTGGQSATARVAGGEAARQGLKAAIKRTATKAYDTIPKIKIDPRKYSQTVPLLMGEGFVFGSTDYYLRQQLFNQLDVNGYDEFSPTEMFKSGAFGATIGLIPGVAIPAGYRYFDAKALRKKEAEDSENFKNVILDKTPEREDVEIIRTDEPTATPKSDAEILTLEEASAESLKLRQRNNNPEPSHVERVDSKEADAFPTEIIRAGSSDISEEAPEVIVVNGETRLKNNPNEKPVIGGMLSRKSYDEAMSTFLLFGKPTNYSRRLAEIDPNFDTFLRLVRHDSMDNMLDNPIAVLNSTAKQQRSYHEQVKDVVGQYMGRMITTIENVENFARQHPRYNQRGQFKVKDGTLLNEDLYTYLVRGDVRGGVPIDVINAAKDLRKIFDDVEKVSINEGFIFHSVENFFPRYYKPGKLLKISRAGIDTDFGKAGKRKEAFAKQLANDEDMSFEEALTAVDDLTSKLYDDLDPTIGSLGQRKYKNLNTIPIMDLFVTDIPAAMSMYLNSMGRKIVRKRTFGFTQDEFEQKWLIPFFGGRIKPTDEVTARELILDRLKARGFTESLIDTSTVGEYTRLNFLIRQNINNEAIELSDLLKFKDKEIKNLQDVKNPKLLLTHIKQLNKIIDETNAQALRPSDRDIITNAQGNNLSEVIDKLIRARLDAGDFILRSQKVKGTLGVDSVIYKGTIKDPKKTMSSEKARVQILKDYIIGVGGVPQGGTNTINKVANSLILIQSANKLGLATLSSLPETLIPFLKSNPSVGLRAFYKTIDEESRMLFKNITTDEKGRTLSRQELNQLNMVLKGSLAEAVQNAYAEGLGATTSKLSYAFYRSILLDQYAKFMQIFSYNAAKIMITDNLTDLSKLSAKELASDKGSVQRLKLPLVNLGIDIDQGVKFIKDNRPVDDIFNEVIRASAGRYVDEVVMNPGRESAQKPLFMSHYFGKVIFQLFSYPVSVFNTVFRNAIRDISLSKGVYAPRNIAVMTTMLLMTRLIRGIKTGGESLEEEYDAEAIIKDLDYMGTGGPLSLIHTAIENNKYGDNEFTALLGILGPTVGGLFVDAIKTNRPEMAFSKNMLPYRNVIAKVRPDLIHDFDQFVKDMGDTLRGKTYTEQQIRRLEDSFGFKEKQAGITDLERDLRELEERQPNFKGGPISSEFPVTDVKDIAAERINPLTGEPYLEEELDRLPMNKGGNSLLDKMQQYFTKEQRNKRLVEKYKKEGTDYIMTEDGPEVIYKGTALAKSLGVEGTEEPGITPVMPVIELAGLISGKKLATESAETVFQSVAKSRVPKKLYHGSTQRNLTELRAPVEIQRFGIFTRPDKQGVVRFTGNKGAIYELDSSDMSSIANMVKFNKNKVLDADKPSSKVLSLIDKDIARLKKSKKTGVSKQDDLFEAKHLEDFKSDMLSPDNYISGYGKGVDSFLKRNNYGVIKTTPNFPKNNATPNYIFTTDRTPINDKFLTKAEFKENPMTGVLEKVYFIESKK